jgi:Flp pilus assembly protein TadG
MIRSFFQRLGRIWRDEGATATIEFVIAVPVILTIFIASFEGGLLMTRQILLDQALDRTMRELRLGRLVNPSADTIKTDVCSRTLVFTNCAASMTIELMPVNTNRWAMPATATRCVDRDQNISPVLTFTPGAKNEMMLVRACIILDAMFPAMGLGLALSKDDGGGYALVAVSAFVNEPTT